nr:Rab geranylgeranyl transferase alpha subunit 1 [Tanacetum cinerariifolium]
AIISDFHFEVSDCSESLVFDSKYDVSLLTSYLESKTSDSEQSETSKWKSEMIATETDHYQDLLTWEKRYV